MPTTLQKWNRRLWLGTAALWLGFASFIVATNADAAVLYDQNDHSGTKYNGGTEAQDSMTLTGTAAVLRTWIYCASGGDTLEDQANANRTCIKTMDAGLGTTRGEFCSTNDQTLSAGWNLVEFDYLKSGDGDLSDVTEIFVVQGADINTGACNTSATGGFGKADTNVFQGQCMSAGVNCDMSFGIAGSGGFTSPPVISAIDVVEDYNNAAISWTTDDAATSEIFWGLTSSYGSNVTDLTEVTSHELLAHTLATGTLYHYKICSTNGDDEETCTADSTFTTLGGDPLADFSVAVYDPPPDRIFGPGIIDNYTFRAVFGVDSNVYPDETIVFDYKLSDSTPTVLYDSPALPIQTAAHYICALPGDCTVTYYAAHFTIPYLTAPGDLPAGDYTIEVRAKTLGGTYGDYSDPVTFTVQSVGCTDADGFIPQAICRIGSLDLIYPSSASTAYFDSAITGFSTTGAAAFFGDAAAIADGTDVVCPLPTFNASKFGYAGNLNMPTYDLCTEATDIAADLNAITAFEEGVQAIVAVLGLLVAVAFFRKFVEG